MSISRIIDALVSASTRRVAVTLIIVGAVFLVFGLVLPGDFKLQATNATAVFRLLGKLFMAFGIGLGALEVVGRWLKENVPIPVRAMVFVCIALAIFMFFAAWFGSGLILDTIEDLTPTPALLPDATKVALEEYVTEDVRFHMTETARPSPTPDASITAAFELLTRQAEQNSAATATAHARATDDALTQTISSQCPSTFDGANSDWDWQKCARTFNGVQMVLVPGGTRENEDPFWIYQFEVTRQEFLECVDGVGSQVGLCNEAMKSYSLPNDEPARYITWEDANTFCSEWRGDALPTRSQWEYALRGPGSYSFPWGSAYVRSNLVIGRPSPLPANVDRGDRSWVGAYDMAGNVMEFVAEGELGEIWARGAAFSFSATGTYTSLTLNLTGDPKTFGRNERNSDIGVRCVRAFSPSDLGE